MKIVIDIPAEDFEKVKCGRGAVSMMRKAIIHGTPLPKGHGRLIDAKQFEIDNKEFWNRDFIHPKYEDTLGELIQDAPTIIVADEAESEDKT